VDVFSANTFYELSDYIDTLVNIKPTIDVMKDFTNLTLTWNENCFTFV
jgi:hypothetical protein